LAKRSQREETRKDWLREGSDAIRSKTCRILGPDTKALRRDLDWWIGRDVCNRIETNLLKSDRQSVESLPTGGNDSQLTVGYLGLDSEDPNGTPCWNSENTVKQSNEES
jgi:hypothetical protein